MGYSDTAPALLQFLQAVTEKFSGAFSQLQVCTYFQSTE